MISSNDANENNSSKNLEDEKATVIKIQGWDSKSERIIAAFAGLVTAGPLGALASWVTIKKVKGRWLPWLICGVPAAITINFINWAIYEIAQAAYPEMINYFDDIKESRQRTRDLSDERAYEEELRNNFDKYFK